MLPGIALAPVADAVVKSVGLPLPELDPLGFDPIAAPMWRPRNFGVCESAFDFGETFLENLSARDLGALLASPCAELAVAGTFRKVRVGLGL